MPLSHPEDQQSSSSSFQDAVHTQSTEMGNYGGCALGLTEMKPGTLWDPSSCWMCLLTGPLAFDVCFLVQLAFPIATSLVCLLLSQKSQFSSVGSEKRTGVGFLRYPPDGRSALANCPGGCSGFCKDAHTPQGSDENCLFCQQKRLLSGHHRVLFVSVCVGLSVCWLSVHPSVALLIYPSYLSIRTSTHLPCNDCSPKSV